MAQQSSPDSPSPWRQSGEVGGGVAQTVDGGEEDGGVGGGESVAVDESLTRENEASKTEVEWSTSCSIFIYSMISPLLQTVESEALRYVDRGSQLLREALDLALQCRDMARDNQSTLTPHTLWFCSRRSLRWWHGQSPTVAETLSPRLPHYTLQSIRYIHIPCLYPPICVLTNICSS